MGDIKSVDEIIKKVSSHYAKKAEPETEHLLVYDSSTETLEPIYFFVLDLMNSFGLKTEKIIDNFVSSPGSGHFSELRGKATAMQQQADTLLKTSYTILRSVLNIVYDLKEFKIRLQSYEKFRSDDKDVKEAARQSLKQIWLDKVDIQRGQGAIHALATGQLGFTTLRDAFLVAKDEKEVEKLDLNDRVKRILKPRLQDFNNWVAQSEKELRKRYDVEKSYLKSQASSLKLYSRWIKPYLKAAQQLEMKEGGRQPALVSAFNTIVFELTLLGKMELKVPESAIGGELPSHLSSYKENKRKYYNCILVDFSFRGIPQKAGQHYVFGGRAEVKFKGYALNEDELKKLDQELDKSDIGDILTLIEGTTTESLEQIQEDINLFLEEKDKDEKKKPKDNSNPFLAIIGKYEEKETKKSKKDDKKPITVKPDDFNEREYIRPLVAEKAKEFAFNLFDVYKKAHAMPSYTR
ncbi:hypothetical protein ACFL0X_01380 [Nanoarchaeota archaeon]